MVRVTLLGSSCLHCFLFDDLNISLTGRELLLFGQGEHAERSMPPVGRVDSSSASMSDLHTIDNISQRDEKYWLPMGAYEAFVCVRFPQPYRITSFAFQNRHSQSFTFEVESEDQASNRRWETVVALAPSGPNKMVREVDVTRSGCIGRRVRLSLTGRTHSSYNPSLFWLEVRGKPAPQ